MELLSDTVEYKRQRIAFERSRVAPPEGFPRFPILPGKRYTDPRFHEIEQKHLWSRAWLLAGHLDEIPLGGCYKSWDMAGKPIILVRTREGGVNAFHNSCRHRGATLARKPTGRAATLVCGYHGWTYSHEGELLSVQLGSREFGDFDKSCRSLVPVRCELFGNLIYINLDPGAPSLQDWLGPIWDEWQQFQLDKLRLIHRHVWDMDCNWKVALEANIENYHLWSIHGDVIPSFYLKEQGNTTLFKNGHTLDITACDGKLGWMAENQSPNEPPAIDTINPIGLEHLEVFNVFPAQLMSAAPAYHVNSPNFWPNGVDRCRFELYHFGLERGEGEVAATWDTAIDFIHRVFDQDIEFSAKVWKGMQSPAYDGSMLGYTESRIYYLHQSSDAFIGVENIPDDLRVEPVIGPEWIYPDDRATISRLFPKA